MIAGKRLEDEFFAGLRLAHLPRSGPGRTEIEGQERIGRRDRLRALETERPDRPAQLAGQVPEEIARICADRGVRGLQAD